MGYWSNQNVPAYPNFNPYQTRPPYFNLPQPAYQYPSLQNIWQSQACQAALANSKRNNDMAKLEELLAMSKQLNAESEKAAKDHLEFMAQFDWNVTIAESSQLEPKEDVGCDLAPEEEEPEKAENPENRAEVQLGRVTLNSVELPKQENLTDRSLLQPIGQNFRVTDFGDFESDLGCSDTAGEDSDRDSDLSSEYSGLSEDTGLGWSEFEKYASEFECESTVVDEDEDTPTEDASPTIVRYTEVDFIFPSFQVTCQLSEFAIKFYAEMSYGKTRSRDFPYRPYNFSKTKWHKILIRELHDLIKDWVYRRTGSISGALFDWLVWVATKVKLPKLMIRET